MMKRILALLALTMMLTSSLTASVHAQPITIATADYFFGKPTVWNDVIAFVSDAGGTRQLMYYTISAGVLTPTGVFDALFPSVYGSTIVFISLAGWALGLTQIGIYNINTGALALVGNGDFLNIVDVAVWNAGAAPPVSVYGNTVGFYDSEGWYYYNIATNVWTPIPAAAGAKSGISASSNIIAFSVAGILNYYNVSTGILTVTGLVGEHPSIMGNDIIAFEVLGGAIFYLVISTGSVSPGGVAVGKNPWIWSDLIVFTTDEAILGADLNGDADMVDNVIRYYSLSSGVTTNTGDVGEHSSLFGRTVFQTNEADLGIDVNGDGDFIDWAVRFMTIRTPGDVNGDGIVDILDVAAISAHWNGPPPGPLGYDPMIDVDNSGVIDIVDLAHVSAYWTGPPPGPLA